jgi:hypothetical protein
VALVGRVQLLLLQDHPLLMLAVVAVVMLEMLLVVVAVLVAGVTVAGHLSLALLELQI